MPLLRALAFISALGPSSPAAECEGVPTTRAARCVANVNRVATGTMRAGVLTVRLVERQASWPPDDPRACGLRPAVDAPGEKYQQALQLLHRFGVTHLLFDKRLLPHFATYSALADPAVTNGSYKLCYQDSNMVLYGLPPQVPH